jgi:hypothetical protein
LLEWRLSGVGGMKDVVNYDIHVRSTQQWHTAPRHPVVKIRLNRKLADILNGIDVRRVKAGEELDLSAHDAELLVAEGWASYVERADDKPRRKPRKRSDPAVS